MRYKQSIYELINSSREHLTAEEVFFRMREHYPKVVLATVYNNLNALCDEGLIRRVRLEGQPDRYDRTTRHDHLFCSQCGRLSDIVLADLTRELEQQVGFHIDAYDLRINYVCPECQAANNKAS